MANMIYNQSEVSQLSYTINPNLIAMTKIVDFYI